MGGLLLGYYMENYVGVETHTVPGVRSQEVGARRREDFSLRQLRRLNNSLVKIRNGTLTRRDVKNEDRSGYVHENTYYIDNMSSEKHGFYMKMHQLHDNRQQSSGLFGRNAQITP
jgi:hypothetical protein